MGPVIGSQLAQQPVDSVLEQPEPAAKVIELSEGFVSHNRHVVYNLQKSLRKTSIKS